LAEREYVVDSSVAARWYVNSSPYVQESRLVRTDFDEDKIAVLAPESRLHEVTSVIHQAVFARRLSARRGREQLERFVVREITWFETNELVLPAWDLSIRYGSSYYDATHQEKPVAAIEG
jgi:predicted nucleic acid-binding protein